MLDEKTGSGLAEVDLRSEGVLAEAVQAFRREGALVVRHLVAPQELAHIEPQFWELANSSGLNEAPADCGLIYIDDPTTLRPDWLGCAFYRSALRLATALIGREARRREDQIIVKRPGYLGHTPWHQDAAYWVRQGCHMVEGVVCWIALSDTGPESSGLQFVPGMHMGEVHAHDDRSARSDIPEAIGMDVGGRQIVAPRLSPGDATFHHYLTPHYSAGNPTANPRAALTFHFWPADP